MIDRLGGDYGLLSRMAGDSANVKRQLDTVLAQESSGKVAETYSGLGVQSYTSLDLRPQIEHVKTWQANIDVASGRIDVTQAALKQVASIAQDFYAQASAINDVGTSPAGTIAAAARNALKQVAQLLNSTDGRGYVFAGQDSANPPLPDTDPDHVAAALLASDTDQAPFSTTIGVTVPEVEVGNGQRVAAGLLANRNTLANAAPGAATTGSYMRDIMKALATLTTVTDDANAIPTAATARDALRGAIRTLSDETGALGTVQTTLATRKTTLSTIETTMTNQLSNAEDVDMPSTLVKVQALQTQLQASYQVTAGLKGLSLSQYL